MLFPSFKHELAYLKQGYALVAGCDEAGRGPLAGPVVAAVCVLNPKNISARRSKNAWHARIRDSKTVPESEREILAEKIKNNSLAYGIGIVWQEEIDKLNIHHASLKAMELAVKNLLAKLEGETRILVLVDGRFTIPSLKCDQKSLVDGDALALSIAAASLIAKVERDAIMHKLDKKFPSYGFARHKGYSTKEHERALKEFGLTEIHRKTFVK